MKKTDAACLDEVGNVSDMREKALKKAWWFGVVFLVMVLDQATKYWAWIALTPYQPEAIFPMFNMTLAFNTGAAFSFLSATGGWHRWILVGFSSVVSVVLIVWMVRISKRQIWVLLGLSLIVGGALSNLIDRLYLGYVIDFIDVYYHSYHWPVFNVADSCICIGALILLGAVDNRGRESKV